MRERRLWEFVMPFAAFTTLGEAAREYQITCQLGNFVEPLPLAQPLPEYFRAELDFCLTKIVFDASEEAICENLIYPILKVVWKPNADDLTLWSHTSLSYD